MTAPRKELFSAMLWAINHKGENPNRQEGWPEGYIHQRDWRAEDSNSGPPLKYKGENPNRHEGKPEGYIHQHDWRAEDSNSGPLGYETALYTARSRCLSSNICSRSI